MRDWCRAAFRGDRHRPKPGDYDPLWLRLGLRMQLIDSRAGWVVSNPILDQVLRRNPGTDPSLPGIGWLREVYRSHKQRSLVTLDGTRGLIEERIAALRAIDEVPVTDAAPKVSPPEFPQQTLFGAEGSA
jgi:hypothetical protein